MATNLPPQHGLSCRDEGLRLSVHIEVLAQAGPRRLQLMGWVTGVQVRVADPRPALATSLDEQWPSVWQTTLPARGACQGTALCREVT